MLNGVNYISKTKQNHHTTFLQMITQMIEICQKAVINRHAIQKYVALKGFILLY